MEEVLKVFEDKIAVLTRVIDRFENGDADGHQDPELVAACKEERKAYRLAAAALTTHMVAEAKLAAEEVAFADDREKAAIEMAAARSAGGPV